MLWCQNSITHSSQTPSSSGSLAIRIRIDARATEDKEHVMSQKLDASPAVIGIDIGKNSFHIVGQNQLGVIVLRQKWSRGQVEARLANLPPCLIGMEACVGAHYLSRTLTALGHDAWSKADIAG